MAPIAARETKKTVLEWQSIFFDVNDLLRLFMSEVTVRRDDRRIQLSSDGCDQCVGPV